MSLWQKVPLVEVRWIDAALDGGSEGELEKPETAAAFGGLKTCRDIGYLIVSNKKVVKLAVSLCEEDNDYRHSNTIPRGWVKEIIYLTRPSQTEAS